MYFSHALQSLPSQKQRYWVLLKLLESLLVVYVLVRQLKYLIWQFLVWTGTLNAGLFELFRSIEEMPQKLRLPPDEIGVGRMLRKSVVQPIQSFLGCFLKRRRPKSCVKQERGAYGRVDFYGDLKGLLINIYFILNINYSDLINNL
jgi:hypothetical protein